MQTQDWSTLVTSTPDPARRRSNLTMEARIRLWDGVWSRYLLDPRLKTATPKQHDGATADAA